MSAGEITAKGTAARTDSGTVAETKAVAGPVVTATLQGLAIIDWPAPAAIPSRGLVLLVHGLGEHKGRYQALSRELNAWGFAVRGYDHYGHGESEGPRGGLPSDQRLVDDLAAVVDDSRHLVGPTGRLLLLGHSLGGLVAASLVARGLRPVDALILSSPALDAGMNAFQKLLVSTLPRLVPNLRVGNGLDHRKISHDPAVVQAYRNDPLVHDRIAARLGRFIADEGPAVIAQAGAWQVPTLLLYAGSDVLVNPDGSRRFAQAAPQALVQSHCFDELFHEILLEAEPGRSAVLATLKRWLGERYA